MDGSTLSYEELEGAAGRKVFFRPKRFKASEIFERPQPQVSLNGQDWLIENVSLSGMALTSAGRTPAPVAIGETCEVVITQCLHPLFEGRAVIRRIDESIRAPQIGISFVGDTLDVAQLLRADASARATARLDLLSSPRNSQVPEEYRLLCTDVLHMLKSYRSFLEGAPKEDAARMVEACLERMMPAWNEFWRRGNEITREAFPDAGQLRAIKELTELVLTPEFCHGAIWDRSYTKPLGYPGDFQVMNYVYDWQAVGETPYEQLVHRIGLDVAECIRTRMLLMEDTIEKEADAMPSGRETRVLSLGSGPAREVASLLKRSGGSNRNYEFTLIDQESEALQYAYENCFPEIASSATNSRLNCLNLSFLDVLRGHVEDDRARDQDIVYSLGLFDYLNDRRARRLASSLFDLLKPGGLMVIGNMNETEMSGLWPIECITDWRLYYRTDEEMCGWGEGLDAEACWTETEETDRVRLLFVRKRA